MGLKERSRLYITAFLVFIIVMITIGGAAIAAEVRVSENETPATEEEPVPEPVMIPIEEPEAGEPGQEEPSDILPEGEEGGGEVVPIAEEDLSEIVADNTAKGGPVISAADARIYAADLEDTGAGTVSYNLVLSENTARITDGTSKDLEQDQTWTISAKVIEVSTNKIITASANDITWTPSSAAVTLTHGTVTDGGKPVTIKAVSVSNNVTVTASIHSLKAQVKINVKAKPPAPTRKAYILYNGSVVNGKSYYLGKGQSMPLTATVSLNGAAQSSGVTWSVSPNGVLTKTSETLSACTLLAAAGSETPVTVTATPVGGGDSASIKIYPFSISVPAASYTLYKGGSGQIITPTTVPSTLPTGMSIVLTVPSGSDPTGYITITQSGSGHKFVGKKVTTSPESYSFNYKLQYANSYIASSDTFTVSVKAQKSNVIEVDDWSSKPVSSTSYYKVSGINFTGWKLVFSSVDSTDSEVEVVQKKVKSTNPTNTLYTDISLYDISNGSEEQMYDSFGTCTIGLPLPTSWDLRQGKVEVYTLHPDDDERTQELSASTGSTSSRPYVSFSTTHFSPFGIAYTKTSSSTSSSSSSSRSSSMSSNSLSSSGRALDGVPKTGYDSERGILYDLWHFITGIFKK
ncbi:MAG: hypothetical protein K6F35_07350 [Lachnospiraceae bacterium]|nr:hypothetical protein [Lachnospiraceae bacterium]